MPPTRKRPRRYDPARTRTAVLAQTQHLVEAVRGLGDDRLSNPAGPRNTTVRELVAGIAPVVDEVSRGLESPAPARQELTLLEWPSRAGRYARPDESGPLGGAALTDLLARASARLTAALDEVTDDERLVATPAGAMRLGDLLVTRCAELVARTDDLNTAAGLDVPLDRQALAAATRLLADALAAKAPGASTEVRVPPFAVVQCVEGPRHTRGTPPNVVETDPLTWVRLATGRTDWHTARDTARLSASGERADLSALLPLLT
ncbi:sterol carrier family protein [Streptomyces sp. NPDC060194]|uniref:sterol carrier family protein n=1 Tax=Streptomyces sp. NPDC060194 TaxID=3347069 RepID=UPI00364AA50F